jgi:hypothetical protein
MRKQDNVLDGSDHIFVTEHDEVLDERLARIWRERTIVLEKER